MESNLKNSIDHKKFMEKGATIVSCVLILVAICLLFYSNRIVPFMMDDEWYSTNLVTGKPLKTLGDILTSQFWHYHNWGGRIFTHGFLQLTLMSGEMVADITNTLLTLVLTFEMTHLVFLLSDEKDIFREKKQYFLKIRVFVLLFGLMITCCPNYKMAMLWQAGCANYVYSTIWILFFYICYLRIFKRQTTDFLFIHLFMIPLGLMTGWSTENMGPTAFVIAFGVTVWSIRNHEPLKRLIWMISGTISALLGSILCLIAPGNFIRENDSTGRLALSITERILQMLRGAGEYLVPGLLLLAASYAFYINSCSKRSGREIILLLAALLSYGAMVLSPHYPDRAAFGTCILMEICTASYLLRSFLYKEKQNGIWITGTMMLISAILTMTRVMME